MATLLLIRLYPNKLCSRQRRRRMKKWEEQDERFYEDIRELEEILGMEINAGGFLLLSTSKNVPKKVSLGE